MYQSDLKHPQASLEKKLHALYALHRGAKIELGFRPAYLDLLRALGNPHLHLPPTIHVAGTNGKGSVIATLRAALEAGGYNMHAYTSPHLVRFNERIVLGGTMIDDAALESLIDEVLAANNGAELSFFEITTALAFTAFARHPADILLLEVGLGGRLDCTNVIPAPLASVITAISMDHMDYLGDTLEQIAAEKAGIIKSGAPCITGRQNPDVMKILQNTAAAQNAPFYVAKDLHDNAAPALIGLHQRENAAIALKTLDVIREDFPLQNDHIQTGLAQTIWPARLQKLSGADYGLAQNWELWLDGGHNEAAGAALAAQAAQWHDQPLYLVLGMMQHKNPQSFTAPLLPHLNALYVVNIEGEPASMRAANLKTLLPTAIPAQNYGQALQNIAENHPPGRILICGSLYLAGHVLKQNHIQAHNEKDPAAAPWRPAKKRA